MLQAVIANNRSTNRLLPVRASTRGSTAVRVVAFREDDRQGSLKRGTREAKGQAKNVQRQGQKVVNQGKQQLQRGEQPSWCLRQHFVPAHWHCSAFVPSHQTVGRTGPGVLH